MRSDVANAAAPAGAQLPTPPVYALEAPRSRPRIVPTPPSPRGVPTAPPLAPSLVPLPSPRLAYGQHLAPPLRASNGRTTPAFSFPTPQTPARSGPSADLLAWARGMSSLGDEGRMPKATALFPASTGPMERSIADRMQLKLFTARCKAAASTYALGAEPLAASQVMDAGGGSARAVASERCTPDEADYAAHVYSAPNTLRGTHHGRPMDSPKRLLSNRWHSAVMFRAFDVRIAAAAAGRDAWPIGGGEVASGGDIRLPPLPGPGGSLSERAVLPSGVHHRAVSGASSSRECSQPSEDGSALSRGVAYRAQLLADAVIPYERRARWQTHR